MNLLHLSLLFLILNFVSTHPTVENVPLSTQKLASCNVAGLVAADNVAGASNFILQSIDGGQTWQNISHSLPEVVQPEDFFAGESDLYLRVKSELYRSKSNLAIPVWEKENVPDPSKTSIVFNRSGVMAFNFAGQIYQKVTAQGIWLRAYKNFDKPLVRNVFETYDGAVFIGTDFGLYKSADKGASWKEVHNEGVMDIAESERVLIATGQKGIMRSTDKGEHWEWIISEGGVGIDVERIDGGFAAIVYSNKTKSRSIRISLDKGKTWKAIDQGLRPASSVSSIKQVGRFLICGHPDGIFRSSDLGKTWEIAHPNFDMGFKVSEAWSVASWGGEGKIFKLYVSGNILYAVVRQSGC